MNDPKNSYGRPVYLVDGMRTPFLKAKGLPGPFSAADLAVSSGKSLLLRQPFKPEALGEIVLGCVMPGVDEANIARIVALRLGCGHAMPAWTVQRNCASGMQAVDSGAKDIGLGRHDLVLVGGTEAMSRAPILLNEPMSRWLAHFSQTKTIAQRLKKLCQLRPQFFRPVLSLLRGLTDPIVNLSMGQTAENLAIRFHIDRSAMDAFALESHRRLSVAQDTHMLSEIAPVYDLNGQCMLADDGLRRDTTLEKLSRLKPFFDKKFGDVTAGNSSQVTDGAALLLLASHAAVKQYSLPVLARIVDTEWSGVSPAEMGLGPVHATAALLKRQGLTMQDIDCWELNEAFAAQVLACLKAWEDADYCRKHLGLHEAFGKLDMACLNIDGGAIALGHPVGASGARIVLHLAHVLKRTQARFGVATICIGGGQGGALLVENVMAPA